MQPMLMGQLKRNLLNKQELGLCGEMLGNILMGFHERLENVDSGDLQVKCP